MAVLVEGALLHVVGEGVNGVAGLSFAGGAADGDRTVGVLHGAFGDGEGKALALFAAVDEVDAEAEVEALGVVEETEQDVGDVAAIVPEADGCGGHGAGGADGSGDEVGAAEEMDEEVAGDAGAVVLPLAPLEEALGVEGDFGGGAQEAGPAAG